MIIKKRLCNLKFGNKGIVFTLDITVALLIVITILIVSKFYIFKSVNELPNIETLRNGYDIVNIMDYDKTLQSLNANQIKNELNILLQNKYDILIRITSSNQNLSIGNPIPNDRFIGGGKIFSIMTNPNNDTYITTNFWIWLK